MIQIIGNVILSLYILFLIFRYPNIKKKMYELTKEIYDVKGEIYAIKKIADLEKKNEMNTILSRLLSLETRVFNLRDELDKLGKMEGENANLHK